MIAAGSGSGVVDDIIARLRVVPVVVLDDAADAAPLADALVRGGLPLAEITFRTAAADAALRVIAADSRLCAGAGTVLTADQVDRAAEAGARFIVSPGFSPAVVARCAERGLPVYPGVATPTEIMQALEAGLRTVKFFPAEAVGGMRALRSISQPFGMMRFVPTGGIDAANMGSYLAHPSVVAVGGSWMVSRALVTAGRFDEVTRLAAEAVAAAATSDE